MLDFSTIIDQLRENAAAFIGRLPAFLLALLVFGGFFWLAGRLSSWVKQFVHGRGHGTNAATIVSLIARWGIITLGALVALSIALPSFKSGDLIQVLGISSVAVGFAFRDIFQNFFAGLIILLTDAFQIGDQIIVEKEGLEGTVTDIQTRATTIATYDEREIVIPNATLFTNAVTINTATDKLRSEQVVGISYDSDLDLAADVILEAVANIDGVLAEPAPDVLVNDLADSSVQLKARWWTDARRSNVIQVKSSVVRTIKQTLDQHDINIPFPIRTVRVESSDETAVRSSNRAALAHGRG